MTVKKFLAACLKGVLGAILPKEVFDKLAREKLASG